MSKNSPSKHSPAHLAVACSAALSFPLAAVAQTLPPQQNTSAYTTDPEAAGITSSSTPPPVLIGVLIQRTNGSLYQAENYGTDSTIPQTIESASYFHVPQPKPKLLRKHDLVTIVIRENSSFTSNGTTDVNRTGDLDQILDSYVTLGLSPGLSLNEHTPNTPIEIKGSGAQSFQGTGDVNRADTFTGRITAEVIDVKPNGTLILEATESIKTDEEEQRVSLIGTCRVDDISADNTVLSNQLYNLSLSKQHKGAVKDSMRRGWLYKFFDWFSPF
jgi:flagellar L-ring protein FlgH